MRSDPFKHLLRLNNEHSEEVPDVDPFLEIRTVPPNDGIEVAFSLIVQLDPVWLRTFLDLPNGIPSHDTFGDVFSRLDPDRF